MTDASFLHLSIERERKAITDAEDALRTTRANAARNFGSGLASVRRKRGMSAAEMARRAGVSAAFICDIEHGRRLPTLAVAREIIDALCWGDPR